MPIDYKKLQEQHKKMQANSAPVAPVTAPDPAPTAGVPGTAGALSGTAQKPGGTMAFLGNMAKEAYKSVVRPLATPFAGFASGIQGLRGKDTEIELPEWAGGAKGSGDLDKQARIAAGAALETAALIPGGEALVGLKGVKGATPLLKLSLAEAKKAALSGALSSAGSKLDTDLDATAGDVIKSGVIGGITGGVVGGAAPVVARGFQKVRGAYAKAAEDAFEAASAKAKAAMPEVVPPASAAEITPEAKIAPTAGDVPKTEGITGEATLKPSQSLHEVDEDFFPEASTEQAVIPEKMRKKAEDYGFKPAQLNNIEQASNAERALGREMQARAKERAVNHLAPDPTEVPAQIILDRKNYLKAARQKAGKDLDVAVKNMPETRVPITEQRDSLMGWLDSHGISVDKEGSLDFSKSKYRSSASKGDQAILQEIFDEFKPTKLDSFAPGQVHKSPQEIYVLRQALRELQEGKIRSGEPLPGQIEALVDSLREELNKPLAKISPAYGKAAKTYAITTTGLNKFYKNIGKKFSDSEDELMGMRIQELLGRLVGNAPASVKQTLDDLTESAVKTGMKVDPNVDVRRLIYIDELLSDVYGLTEPRSLQGGFERGAKNVAEGIGAVGDVAMAAHGNPLPLVNKALSILGKVTPEKRQKLIEELLSIQGQMADPTPELTNLAGAIADKAGRPKQ